MADLSRTGPLMRARELTDAVVAAAGVAEQPQHLPAGLVDWLHETGLFRLSSRALFGSEGVEPGGLHACDRGTGRRRAGDNG